MVDRIAQHRHCKECDKAIPYKDKFCDENCEKEWKGKMLTKKRQLIYFYIAMVAILVIAVVLGLVGQFK
jgi:predicted nucleic acid-binding Zn ribbon protein